MNTIVLCETLLSGFYEILLGFYSEEDYVGLSMWFQKAGTNSLLLETWQGVLCVLIQTLSHEVHPYMATSEATR